MFVEQCVKSIMNLFNYFFYYNIVESHPCTSLEHQYRVWGLGPGAVAQSICPRAGPGWMVMWDIFVLHVNVTRSIILGSVACKSIALAGEMVDQITGTLNLRHLSHVPC